MSMSSQNVFIFTEKTEPTVNKEVSADKQSIRWTDALKESTSIENESLLQKHKLFWLFCTMAPM